jgi:hypothetical protein
MKALNFASFNPRNQLERSWQAEPGFDTEDGGEMFLRNFILL